MQLKSLYRFKASFLIAFLTALHEFNNLMLELKLFHIFGNITFGNFSKDLHFAACVVSFTTLSEDIGLNICLNEAGNLSRKRSFENSAMQSFNVSSKFKISRLFSIGSTWAL